MRLLQRTSHAQMVKESVNVGFSFLFLFFPSLPVCNAPIAEIAPGLSGVLPTETQRDSITSFALPMRSSRVTLGLCLSLSLSFWPIGTNLSPFSTALYIDLMLSLTRRLTPSIFARCNIRFSSSSTPSIPPLIGSAPSYPRHLVIHTPQRSTAWPSHLESVSPLYKHLGEQWSKSSETRLKELGFGVSEGGDKATGQSEVWDPSKSKFDQPPTNINDGSEEFVSFNAFFLLGN